MIQILKKKKTFQELRYLRSGRCIFALMAKAQIKVCTSQVLMVYNMVAGAPGLSSLVEVDVFNLITSFKVVTCFDFKLV